MKGFEFVRQLQRLWAEYGNAGTDIVFRSELGDYVVLDVEKDARGRTVVLLLEEGK